MIAQWRKCGLLWYVYRLDYHSVISTKYLYTRKYVIAIHCTFIRNSNACFLMLSLYQHFLTFAWKSYYNTLRPKKDGLRFAEYIFKRMFLNEKVWISNKISRKFVPKGSIYNKRTLVQIVACRSLTHTCVIRPQWVNLLKQSDAYMRYHTKPSVVQIMACHQFSAKPFSEPTLVYCQLGLSEHASEIWINIGPTPIFIEGNNFGNIVCKTAVIFSRPHDEGTTQIAALGNIRTMTSSNGNIFRVTGHLCGEFTGLRWIPRTKASDAELWCFLLCVPE